MEPEDVAVRAVPDRRTGPPVADGYEVVSPLERRGLPPAEARRLGRNPPRQPVREGPSRRVRIFDDQGQGTRTRRDSRPPKRRRDVLALARMTRWDGSAVREFRARQLHG